MAAQSNSGAVERLTWAARAWIRAHSNLSRTYFCSTGACLHSRYVTLGLPYVQVLKDTSTSTKFSEAAKTRAAGIQALMWDSKTGAGCTQLVILLHHDNSQLSQFLRLTILAFVFLA